VRRLVALGALLAWAALLLTPALDPMGGAAGVASLRDDLRSLSGAALGIGWVLLAAMTHALCFAPLGLFGVFTLPDYASRLRRALLSFVPAVALATTVAWVVLARRAGAAPGPFELILPGLGIVFGSAAALAWRRGWRARIQFLPSLLALAAVLALVLAGLVFVALDADPALPETRPLSSAEKRHLVELFQGKNPRKVPVGETRTLRLEAGDLDRLAGWAVLSGARVRTSVRPWTGGLSAVAALRVPRIKRWLNVEASARAGIDHGRLAADGVELRVGRIWVPSLLLRALTPFVVAGLQGDRDLRRVLPAVESLAFTADVATLTYGRVDMPPGLITRLVWGEEEGQAIHEAVYAIVDRLFTLLPATPEGDGRFARALVTAFALAHERDAAGSFVEENRAAILAIGVVLGHTRLAGSVGERLDDERSELAQKLYSGTTLRARSDWVRHFCVSGALTVLASVAPSNAIGVLKEELDADGGSGFSFGDLLADRAGTTFAEVATRDEASAARIQQRLARGFRVDDFFPPATDLPEGIQDAELQSRYGGVGGARYRQQAEEIERRIARCEAYKP
jgi:hypothetical protein